MVHSTKIARFRTQNICKATNK